MSAKQGKTTTGPRPNRFVIWVLAAVALGVAGFWARSAIQKPAESKTYQVVDVLRTNVSATVVANGTLQPWTVVDIKSKAGGKVEELPVEVGDSVTQGQILARIDPSDSQLSYNQSQADLDSALAKGKQSVQSLALTQSQTSGSIQEAIAKQLASVANLAASEARIQAAQDALSAEETLAAGAIRQAELALQTSLEDSNLLDLEQAGRKATVEANLRKAAEGERFARAEFDRLVSLEKKGFVAGREVEQARNSLESAEAQLSVARTDSANLAQTQRAEQRSRASALAQARSRLQDAQAQAVSVKNRRNSLKVAQTEAAASRQQVRQAEVALKTARAGTRTNEIRRLEIAASESNVFRARSSLANAKKTLDDTVLRAPSAGIVLQKYVEQGTIITSGQAFNSAGTSILQIADVSRMYVSVQVDETDIGRVRIGQRTRIAIDAFGEDRFRGQVIRIEPLAKVEQNITTVSVRVEVDRGSPQFRNLKPNMNATCTFEVERRDDVLALPADAIQSDEDGSFVLVAVQSKPTPNPGMMQVAKSEKRRVETGLEGDVLVEIRSGLEEGERVAFQPVEQTSSSGRTSSGSPFGGGFGGPGGPPPGGGGPGR